MLKKHIYVFRAHLEQLIAIEALFLNDKEYLP